MDAVLFRLRLEGCVVPLFIGTLRGVGGMGVGDCISLHRLYEVLIMGIKAPYPPSPYPPRGPYELWCVVISSFPGWSRPSTQPGLKIEWCPERGPSNSIA